MNYLKKVSEETEGKEVSKVNITEISSFYKNILTQVKQYHQQTESNSLHLYLGEFYTCLSDLEDLLTEAMQGCYSERIGVIENYQFSDYSEENIFKLLGKVKENTCKYREILKSENGLVNVLDDIETLVCKAMYTFTLK